mgnify:CR=1 FL=1|jgi:sugar/nucleoside kinase (ribokinase family)
MRTLQELVQALCPQKKVFILGSAFVDMILSVHEMPHAGADVEGKFKKTVVGGCSFNVADVLWKLDLPFDSYMPVGEGQFADLVEQTLNRRNLPVYRERGAGDNGWCLSIADHTGERTFISMFGLERQMKAQWFDRFDISGYDFIYVSGYQAEGENGEVILSVLKRKADHALIVFDPGPRVTEMGEERLKAFESLGCLYTVNCSEAMWMTDTHNAGDAAVALSERTGNPTVVTDGGNGAVYTEKKPSGWVARRVAGFKIDLVDTIGSGDAHTGGIIASLMCGLTMAEATLVANAVAAHVTAHEGAATAPTRTELQQYSL